MVESVVSRLRLNKLVISGFRTWESLTFKFEKGITLICGNNGAGKSSIRLGAQYALTGSAPKLTRAKLIKREGKNPFSVSLSITAPDGTPIEIRRTTSQQVISIGGEDMSVRENIYTKKLKTASTYTFLSPDIAAFADVQPYKRRELLTDVIPEVMFFRDVCAPRVADYAVSVYKRKMAINNTIYVMEGIISEQENSLVAARKMYEEELARIQSLKNMMKAQLPYTEEEVEGFKAQVTAYMKEVAKLEDYISKMTSWLDHARTVNYQNVNLQSSRDNLLKEKTIIETRRSVLNEKSLVGEPKHCPSCEAELVCNACGTAITTSTQDAAAQRKLEAALNADEARIDAALEKIIDQLKDAGVIDADEITSGNASLQKAKATVSSRQANIDVLNEKIQHYEKTKKNLDEVNRTSLNTRTANSMKEQIDEIELKIATAKKTLERKKKTVAVMGRTEELLRGCENAFKILLPEIYFNKFMDKLTAYSNYLLSHISDMSVHIYADGKDVNFTVDGKDYEQLSSGERQRVKTATTLAFSLMTDASDTLFIDEVFDAFLDSDGIDALAILFSTVMPKFYEKIIIISNQVLLMNALNPDRVINVAQDDSGTSRVMEN